MRQKIPRASHTLGIKFLKHRKIYRDRPGLNQVHAENRSSGPPFGKQATPPAPLPKGEGFRVRVNSGFQARRGLDTHLRGCLKRIVPGIACRQETAKR